MFTQFAIRERLGEVFNRHQVEILSDIIFASYNDLVKTSDFNELKGIVADIALEVKGLAQAQKKTEERMEELTSAQKKTEERMEELTSAQKETQKEVTRLDKTMQELAQAQKETEARVSELAIAQKETEARISELAIAQKETQKEVTRLDKTMEELAQAQKETKEELRTLVISHKDLQKQVGGLSHTVGFRLEDESYKALPGLLEKDFGLIVKSPLKRRYIKDKEGRYIEINIIGEATQNGKKITIIGEGKSQISKADINDFIRKKIKRLNGVFDEIFPVLITYMTQEYDTEEYAQKKGIALYYSYDF